MKFPRNARIFRGQLDAAPFATVLFLLVIFVLLGSLVYTPGVRIDLPFADDLPAIDAPTVAVALDVNGKLYYANQLIEEPELKRRLKEEAAQASQRSQSLALLLQADKSVSYEKILRLTILAREAGIPEAILATLPRPIAKTENNTSP